MRVNGLVISEDLIREIAIEMRVKDLRQFEFFVEDNINKKLCELAEEWNDQEARDG